MNCVAAFVSIASHYRSKPNAYDTGATLVGFGRHQSRAALG